MVVDHDKAITSAFVDEEPLDFIVYGLFDQRLLELPPFLMIGRIFWGRNLEQK